MGERVETLNREVENLQAAGQRLGALEARLATQCRETRETRILRSLITTMQDEEVCSIASAMIKLQVVKKLV